jgi:hypothetical protein
VTTATEKPSAVTTTAIAFAARPQPTPGETRTDCNRDPIEWNEQLVKRGRGYFDVVNQGERAHGKDPDNDELANASSVDHRLALINNDYIRYGWNL